MFDWVTIKLVLKRFWQNYLYIHIDRDNHPFSLPWNTFSQEFKIWTSCTREIPRTGLDMSKWSQLLYKINREFSFSGHSYLWKWWLTYWPPLLEFVCMTIISATSVTFGAGEANFCQHFTSTHLFYSFDFHEAHIPCHVCVKIKTKNQI